MLSSIIRPRIGLIGRLRGSDWKSQHAWCLAWVGGCQGEWTPTAVNPGQSMMSSIVSEEDEEQQSNHSELFHGSSQRGVNEEDYTSFFSSCFGSLEGIRSMSLMIILLVAFYIIYYSIYLCNTTTTLAPAPA